MIARLESVLICAVALTLALGSSLYGLNARARIRAAYAATARADSVYRNLITQGCVPRTRTFHP